jgi:peroxiredoxin
MNQKNLTNVDWSKIPKPEGEENLTHLNNYIIKPIKLKSTQNELTELSEIKGLTIIYVYPMTGQPDKPLPDNWDNIPGARGCTPQSCSFRDNFHELKRLNISNIFGLSSQTSEYQREMVQRLKLPYEVLSDEKLEFAKQLNLPIFEVGEIKLIKRITLILDNNKIIKYFYPVFPPDKNVDEVIAYLKIKNPQKFLSEGF